MKSANLQRYLLVGLVLAGVTALAILVFGSTRISASGVFDWLASPATIRDYDPVSDRDYFPDYAPGTDCAMMAIPIGVERTSVNACVFSGVNFQAALVCDRDSCERSSIQSSRIYLKNSQDDTFYKFSSAGSATRECLFVSPQADVLVAGCWSPRVILDVPNWSMKVQVGSQTEYHVDPVHPFQFANPNGYRLDINGIAMSRNGRWIVGESGQSIYFIMDTTTGLVKSFKQFTSPTPDRIPKPSLTVSDDGEWVVLAGHRVALSVYHISDGCGVSTYYWAYQLGMGENSAPLHCPNSDKFLDRIKYPYMQKFAGEYYATKPQLSYDGGQLRAEIRRFGTIGVQGKIVVTATNFKRAPISQPSPFGMEYLALGDSYTSGEGDVGDGDYYFSGTEQIGGCHLSSRSYPYLLRDKWEFAPAEMHSVACSGAQMTPDLYWTGPIYLGQGNRLADLSEPELDSQKSSALADFSPGIVSQLEFVRQYKPRIITLAGGGNDVGFGDILAYCAAPSLASLLPHVDDTCAYAKDADMRTSLNRTIDEQAGRAMLLLDLIREASPKSTIYVIGYPQFIEEQGICDPTSPLLNTSERQMIRESVQRLNRRLYDAANYAGARYVHIENSLAGGQICQGSKYMTGPLRSIFLNRSIGVDQNMYHPNAKGHQQMAQAVYDDISSGIEYQPEAFDYVDSNSVIERMKITTQDRLSPGSDVQISIPDRLFDFESEVIISIYSERQVLGTAYSDFFSPTETTVTIPEDIDPGYHLLEVSGLDMDHRFLRIHQIVAVTGGDPNDIDGDGIDDSEDQCFAVAVWMVDDVNICAAIEVEDPGAGDATDDDSSGDTIDDEGGESTDKDDELAGDGEDLSEEDGAGPLINDQPKGDLQPELTSAPLPTKPQKPVLKSVKKPIKKELAINNPDPVSDPADTSDESTVTPIDSAPAKDILGSSTERNDRLPLESVSWFDWLLLALIIGQSAWIARERYMRKHQ